LHPLKRKAVQSKSLPREEKNDKQLPNDAALVGEGMTLKQILNHIKCNHYAAVERALKNGDVSANAKDPSTGQTLLMTAVRQGHMNICKCLLRKGAKPNGRGTNGRTPIFVAIESEHFEIMEELISCGAKVNAQDKSGQTPIHIATKMKSIDTL